MPTIIGIAIFALPSLMQAQEANSTEKRIAALEQQLREERDARKIAERQLRESKPATKNSRLFVRDPANRSETIVGLPNVARANQLGDIAARPNPVNMTTGVLWRYDDSELKRRNEINSLVQQIAKSDDETEKESIKADLKDRLEEQYDAYLDKMEAPIKELEERLVKLRNEFEKRKAARDELVKLRLDSFWYKANGMSWPGEGRSATINGSLFNSQSPFSITRPARFPGQQPWVPELDSTVPEPALPPLADEPAVSSPRRNR
ncbi:MAG: hypothetical protein AAFN77_12685 [Planctomycetota bacterium]